MRATAASNLQPPAASNQHAVAAIVAAVVVAEIYFIQPIRYMSGICVPLFPLHQILVSKRSVFDVKSTNFGIYFGLNECSFSLYDMNSGLIHSFTGLLLSLTGMLLSLS